MVPQHALGEIDQRGFTNEVPASACTSEISVVDETDVSTSCSTTSVESRETDVLDTEDTTEMLTLKHECETAEGTESTTVDKDLPNKTAREGTELVGIFDRLSKVI